MVDPFAEVVMLLQPSANFAKVVSGAGLWSVERQDSGKPFYCAILEGSSRMTIDGDTTVILTEGDFVLSPALYGFAMSSNAPAVSEGAPPSGITFLPGEVRLGDVDGEINVRMLVGHFQFGSPDAALLVSLLPRLIHVRGEPRLEAIVKLLGDEARAQRPARDTVLARLMEVLLVEALRSSAGTAASPGLLRGLSDERLAAAIRLMHENPKRDWTVEQLAQQAALSRSAFFERFRRAVGVAPMEYLLAWRMALAKSLLRGSDTGLKEIAERVGYGSASAFSVAFSRHVGVSPTRYAESLAAGS